MQRTSTLSFGVIGLCFAGSARAQSAGQDLGWSPPQVQLGPVREREAERDEAAYAGPWKLERRWYGWQTLTLDAATVAVSLLANSEYAFLGGYWGASPLLHLAHGNAGHAVGSLGLRIGLPLLGIGMGKGVGADGESGDPGIFLGALLGAAVGAVVDAAWLGWEDVRVPAPATTPAGASPAPSSRAESPVVSPGWRAEVSGWGAWVPATSDAERGGELRHAHGLRMGAGYASMSFGFEYSLYRLGRSGYTAEFDMYFPYVGVSFDLGGSVRAGLEAALGFGRAEFSDESPAALRGRASLTYVDKAFGAGPFVGYAHNLASGVQGESPTRFGMELGGSLSVWVW